MCKIGLVSTLVWQSPTPDWHSLSSSYIFVSKLFLTTSLCKLTLYPMYLSAARTKCQMLGGICVCTSGMWWQPLESD